MSSEMERMRTDATDTEFVVRRARQAQQRLAKEIIRQDVLPNGIRLIAGVDVAYTRSLSIGAVTVLDYASMKVVEKKTAACRTPFPYISTLLSFREIQPIVLSVKRLHSQPDIFLVDGHGYAHPYRCGLASHLGLVIRKPTIGVAKNRLSGRAIFSRERDVELLLDGDEIVGAAVITMQNHKPVYVSVGHMISLRTAIDVVKHCTRHTRIPEPILKAHQTAAAEKQKVNISPPSNL